MMRPETKKKLQRSDDCYKAASRQREEFLSNMAHTEVSTRLGKEWTERPEEYRERCYHGERYVKFAGVNCFMD